MSGSKWVDVMDWIRLVIFMLSEYVALPAVRIQRGIIEYIVNE